MRKKIIFAAIGLFVIAIFGTSCKANKCNCPKFESKFETKSVSR